MAGFRTFATGEVLTAANVNNFLMKQSVMVFADATARTAALGTDVVEGMLTYNLATDQLEVFDGTAFIAARAAGIGSNVVSVTKTDHFSTASATFVDITDLSVTITPSAASSKVLVVAQFAAGHSSSTGSAVTGRVLRDATPISVGTVGTGSTFAWLGNFFSAGFITSVTLDSPATAAATVYKMQLRASAGTGFINRPGNDSSISFSSSITVIEVAA